MKKILDKWYIGFVILPILINLLTVKLDFPTLLKNWNFTIIGTLLIISLVSIYELAKLKKENKNLKLVPIRDSFIPIDEFNKLKKENDLLKFIPKESDKKIVTDLLETLDIIIFQDKICEQSSWYGYEKEAMHRTFEFCEKARLIKYKTADEKLNELIQSLRINLDEFHKQSSTILYSDDDITYSPDKNNPVEIERAKKIYPEIDKKSKKAFIILTELLDYLKQRNYLE